MKLTVQSPKYKITFTFERERIQERINNNLSPTKVLQGAAVHHALELAQRRYPDINMRRTSVYCRDIIN